MLSFIIPTYNRKNLIQETLDSILESDFKENFEVIIVDDCSGDGTEGFVKNKYAKELCLGIFKYYFLEKNIGVTGAKNYGAKVSSGEWLVFLDSDDLFIKDSKKDFLDELNNNRDCGAIFFRCNTFDGNLIGKKFYENIYYDLDIYLNMGFPGECLPVIKREVAIKFPYEDKLRGFEHIAYFRMLKSGIKICVSKVIARLYRTENNDRLSTLKGKIKRVEQFYEGYKLNIQEYKSLKLPVPRSMIVKYHVYKLLFFFKFLLRRT